MRQAMKVTLVVTAAIVGLSPAAASAAAHRHVHGHTATATTCSTHTTVNYGTGPDEQETLIYRDGMTHPTILFVHGGGWDRGEANGAEVGFAGYLCTISGYNVAWMNYPTTSLPRWKYEPGEVVKAINKLKTMSHVGVHLFLYGESAGGQLALETVYWNPTIADAVASVSGPTDLIAEYDNPPTTSLVLNFIPETPDQAAAGDHAYTLSSPVDLVGSSDPATFQAVGADDVLVPSSEITDLDSDLAAQGVAHQALVVAGHSEHATDLEPIVPAGGTQSVSQQAVAFLIAHKL